MSWKNPYVERITDFPSVLLSSDRGTPLDEHLQLFLQKKLQYASVILEPCSGSGGHILQVAKASPECLCVGIELRYKRAYRTVEKAEKAGINNVMVFRADVRKVMELLPEASVVKLYLNFPDPWDRARWEKHRVMNQQFLDRTFRLLSSEGDFYFKTDHESSFSSAVELFSADQRFIILTHNNNLPAESSAFQSEFENLFRTKNEPVHYLHVKKR